MEELHRYDLILLDIMMPGIDTFCQMGTMTQGICKLKNNEKKNKKIQHERMRQGNARIIVIHSFVFGLSIFLSLLVKSNGWNV